MPETQNKEFRWLNQQQKQYLICPRCRAGELDTRIPRPALMKLFFGWLPIRRYQCNNCQAKVYRRLSPGD